MTFRNLLEPGTFILLRSHSYLFGSLERIAFDYSLLKVKRNLSGHKSFLISCAEALPRAHCMLGWLLIGGSFLGSQFLQSQEDPSISPREPSHSPEPRGQAGSEGPAHLPAPKVAQSLSDYFQFPSQDSLKGHVSLEHFSGMHDPPHSPSSLLSRPSLPPP